MATLSSLPTSSMHYITQLSNKVGWAWGYVMWGVRIISYSRLSVSRCSLKNKWDSGEALSLNIIRMEQLIITKYCYALQNNTIRGCFHHGPQSCPMSNTLLPWSHFMVVLPWSNFSTMWFWKPFDPSLRRFSQLGHVVLIPKDALFNQISKLVRVDFISMCSFTIDFKKILCALRCL